MIKRHVLRVLLIFLIHTVLFVLKIQALVVCEFHLKWVSLNVFFTWLYQHVIYLLCINFQNARKIKKNTKSPSKKVTNYENLWKYTSLIYIISGFSSTKKLNKWSGLITEFVIELSLHKHFSYSPAWVTTNFMQSLKPVRWFKSST
jgi:hypothetical protein